MSDAGDEATDWGPILEGHAGDAPEGGGVGGAVARAAGDVLGSEAPAPDAPGVNLGGLEPGAIERMGRAIGEVLEYQHDTEDDPPQRSGPYPAGGPH